MKKMISRVLCVALFVMSGGVRADLFLSQNPVWHGEADVIPTGVGWADIDGDGWLDLVVSNGLDAVGAPNTVYFNLAGDLSTAGPHGAGKASG